MSNLDESGIVFPGELEKPARVFPVPGEVWVFSKTGTEYRVHGFTHFMYPSPLRLYKQFWKDRLTGQLYDVICSKAIEPYDQAIVYESLETNLFFVASLDRFLAWDNDLQNFRFYRK